MNKTIFFPYGGNIYHPTNFNKSIKNASTLRDSYRFSLVKEFRNISSFGPDYSLMQNVTSSFSNKRRYFFPPSFSNFY